MEVHDVDASIDAAVSNIDPLLIMAERYSRSYPTSTNAKIIIVQCSARAKLASSE